MNHVDSGFLYPWIVFQKYKENSSLKYPFYTAGLCSSSMDLAWKLHEAMDFPEWSSVVVERQQNGRGQFGRTWISPSGNLYASLRLPSEPTRSSPLAPFLIANAISKVLSELRLDSEFKWPNDILICRKKAGGVLLEERAGVLIAGIGINVSEAPVMSGLRDPGAIPATHLMAFGVCLTPLELWSWIIQEVMDQVHILSSKKGSDGLFRALEGRMAFLGEKVVFKTHDAKQFPAVVAGLSRDGGIRLKTAGGEKILHSGSLFPVIY
jgi:BirA family transcriptional regulator, biotin operon repressor / biotin---[acetyl-CoA-carboxylase] ligase